jgi:magnesium-transporting ATPase (P-type)
VNDYLSGRSSLIAHSLSAEDVLTTLQSSPHGLTSAEADKRLSLHGPNTLPQEEAPGLWQVFLSQFASPLIYILIAAALLSVSIQEWSDAIFISAVLLINAVIGTIQEFSAQRAAVALKNMVSDHCRVVRDGDTYEIDTELLVPGDIILLESGDRVPADVRLITSHDLEMDESLLTGESMNVFKDASTVLEVEVYLGDRRNIVFAGTLVSRGRARGAVVSTALDTELGNIAATVLSSKPSKPPLLIRMERFTYRVAILVGVAAVLLASITLSRGMPLTEIFLLTIALAVSAIPEGLPVAITVALAISMRRMAKRHVIIRRLIAVEALGSCTFIATDKTGTLTVNQLTAKRLVLPNGEVWKISDKGMESDEAFITSHETLSTQEQAWLEQLCKAAVLPNDAFLGHRDGGWAHHGDAVDVALLVMSHKAGVIKTEIETESPEIGMIAFESERLYAASLNQVDSEQHIFIKGALERLLPMCTHMVSPDERSALDQQFMLDQAHQLASQGYRVLALATGKASLQSNHSFTEDHLSDLTLIGLVGMIDPLRPEAKDAVASCHQAGIDVAMITGDHPATAMSIAREL